jgi:hypothetical protein
MFQLWVSTSHAHSSARAWDGTRSAPMMAMRTFLAPNGSASTAAGPVFVATWGQCADSLREELLKSEPSQSDTANIRRLHNPHTLRRDGGLESSVQRTFPSQFSPPPVVRTVSLRHTETHDGHCQNAHRTLIAGTEFWHHQSHVCLHTAQAHISFSIRHRPTRCAGHYRSDRAKT